MSNTANRPSYTSVIRLRPHHLLCTQGYSGKGYSDDFVSGMSAVTDRLRNDPEVEIEITFSSDNICTACPAKLGEGLCADDAKVLRYDAAVRDILDLEEKRYSYHELIRRLDEYLNACEDDKRLRIICGDCNWYLVSACSKNIREEKYVLTSIPER